jgi:hypothetical protein
MSEKREPRTTIVEWIDATRPAVIGWLFAAMSESEQWDDLRLRVREGHPLGTAGKGKKMVPPGRLEAPQGERGVVSLVRPVSLPAPGSSASRR